MGGSLKDGVPLRFRQLSQNYARELVRVVRTRSQEVRDNARPLAGQQLPQTDAQQVPSTSHGSQD